MAKKRKTRPRRSAAPTVTQAVLLLLVAGGAGGIVYNVLSPRGIFAPVPVVTPSPQLQVPSAPAQPRPKVPSSVAPEAPESARLSEGGMTSASAEPVAAEASPAEAPAEALAEALAEEPDRTAPVVISLEEAYRIYREDGLVWVDARPNASFKFGHVPGAVNLPSSDFAAGYARESAKLPRAKRLVVYCSSADCDESEVLIEALREKGYKYKYLLHFEAGWNAWELANYPQESGAGR